MAYINSTRTVVNNVGTDIALAGAGNLFTVSGSVGGTKSLTLSDGFIANGAPEANLIVPLLFPNGHNDLGPSLYLEITVAGVTNPIPVVSNQNGTLAPIPHHEMLEGGSTVYKVVDPNTILNVYYTADYDGDSHPAFVVVGNPLVLSSSTYSIYANGSNGGDLIGTIKPFYLSSAPIGWLELNGSTFDSSKYSSLYSLLGTNKLPDFRECVLVGAGQSDNEYDASTNPNGIHEHDVYTVGQFKDDQFQGHEHSYQHTNKSQNTAGNDWLVHNALSNYTTNGIVSDSINGTPRIGSTTHGKQVGVLYCIKAV